MNFQQILKIPLYLTMINTICKHNYIKEHDNSERTLNFMPKIVNVTDKFYIQTYDESLIPIDYEDRRYSRHVFGEYIYKALITIKVFEDTNKNPLGMYMLDQIKIPDDHDKRGYRTLADKNCKYNDFLDVELYHTLVIMDKK